MDWKDLLKNVAPVLGTALGGPLGGMAITAIGEALGMPKASQDVLKNVLSNPTPEQLLAIKNVEQDFALKMQQLGFEHVAAIEKLNAQVLATEVQDRISARSMQVSTQSVIVPIMAVLVTLGFFSILFFMVFAAIPPENKDVLNNVIGSLGTAWIMVISFYFGSGLGSHQKDSMLSRVRQQAR